MDKRIRNGAVTYVLVTRWSVYVLYSAAYTFIDIWRAIPATKLLATSSYMLGF